MPKSGETVKRAVSIPHRQKFWISEYVSDENRFSNRADFILHATRRLYYEISEAKGRGDMESALSGLLEDPSVLDEDRIDESYCESVQVTWPAGFLYSAEALCDEIDGVQASQIHGNTKRQRFRRFVICAVEREINNIKRLEGVDYRPRILGLEQLDLLNDEDCEDCEDEEVNE